MRKLLIILILYSSQYLTGQDVFGCLNLNFETIPNQTPFEGLEISDQYRDEFGVTFSLEGGGFPILAQVGGPAIAFGSDFGNDTPAPNQNVGSFFLTDDGILQDVQSETILINFEFPIDSVSGCILDMDFEEEFVLDALDINGEIIFTQMIQAGDPGTGDGLATCWGFNGPGCNGEIYAIRMNGFRPPSVGGFFGLGLDNLAFCFQGIDLIGNINVQTIPAHCGENNGSIIFETLNDEIYNYSLEGQAFLTEGIYQNLAPGEYLFKVRNEEGCESEFIVEIQAAPPIEINANVLDTKCTENNGSIELITNDPNAIFSLDSIEFMLNNTFQNLSPGPYQLFVLDEYGCPYTIYDTIAESTLPIIDIDFKADETCEYKNGIINVSAENGTGEYAFFLNDTISQEGNFTGLSADTYLIFVEDSDGCVDSIKTSLITTPGIDLNPTLVHPECQIANGEIIIIASGGTGEFNYTLDNLPTQSNPNFENLNFGSYIVEVTDELDCRAIAEVSLNIPQCPIYIPNLFNPDLDSNNNTFQLQTYATYPVQILDYRIYDRWGNLIYYNENFPLHGVNGWWDGYFNGKLVEQGVYAYLITVLHENGVEQVFVGDVTLVR